MPFNPLGLPLEYASKDYRNGRTSSDPSPQVLWRPSNPEMTPMSRYRRHVNQKFAKQLQSSHDLHRWSVTEPHAFWIDLYEYTSVIPPLPPDTQLAYDPQHKMRDIPPFFPGHRLNFAENVLVLNTKRDPHAIAITELREGRIDCPEHITWQQLWDLVRLTRSAMIRSGIKRSDVVAALMSNSTWIVVVFLATASIGAFFTSISPDMGAAGCVSRLSQVNPKLLFSDTDFALRGVRHSLLGKIQQVQRSFSQTAASPPKIIFVPTTTRAHLHRHMDFVRPLGILLYDFLLAASSNDELVFDRVSASHPVVILYSSGTTGTPKCILSPHMSILNFKKVALLHNSLDHTSTVFQYSSTSWVVWNVMMGHLSVGVRLVTYDGGALYPSPVTLLQICERYGVTYWGTSPRYLLELEQARSRGIEPKNHDLSRLKMVTTTGATLIGPQMRWFYTAFPTNVHLSSIAGGTEIASSWIASDPAGPVHENEMQMWALGHDNDILDPETGESVMKNGAGGDEIGELVCRKPFASMPVGFWNDHGNKKYREAYFERFVTGVSAEEKVEYLDVWTQHDITIHNPKTRGLQITARSDSTLNPSGIRFGPSEIYSIISSPSSSLKDKISDALCVGRKRQGIDKDETVFLFLIAQKPHPVDGALVEQVRSEIGKGLSDRHVPKFIIGMPDGAIPYTVNGKKVEVLIKKILSGDVEIDSKGAVVGGKPGAAGAVSTILNPECLPLYVKYKDLERDGSKKRSKL